MKLISKLVAKIAIKAAISAHGAASEWTTYQPIEPAALKMFIK